MRFHEEVCYVAVAWDTCTLLLQLFGTSEEVVIKLRLLGRLEPFSRGCDRMRASFDEVSSRRLYNIASLGGTADQLKNEISYISLCQSLHLFLT